MFTNPRRTVVALLTALTVISCQESTSPEDAGPDPATGTAVQLQGTLANSLYSGDIDITIAATPTGATAAVTGCVYVGTPTCAAVPGNYTLSSKALAFSTTSPALSFAGTYASGLVEGTVTGTGGTGSFLVKSGTQTVFCGTYTGDSDGVFNLVISGNTAKGVYVDEGDDSGTLNGSVSGTALTVTTGTGITANGTISGSSASGTWSGNGDSGTWTGTTANCR
jgi:hypothetical protein